MRERQQRSWGKYQQLHAEWVALDDDDISGHTVDGNNSASKKGRNVRESRHFLEMVLANFFPSTVAPNFLRAGRESAVMKSIFEAYKKDHMKLT